VAAYDTIGVQSGDVLFPCTEIDFEYGVMVYAVEFDAGGCEYSAEIDASTGAVIQWEKEWDDRRPRRCPEKP